MEFFTQAVNVLKILVIKAISNVGLLQGTSRRGYKPK